eukprot:CAMPEP_0206243630 /NCGR_PEP_ID=MMETSP0047_2-20121206/17707_1 /ASSEMBLY_ACC=CAM_ASM_000192 /TAXON_ID=195065 /ORGANISM="Chroomonas mesostigmatica_cf, Strain CCMP1168" /LENGTH=93 /DNA_ID=CAMNT_0053668757 /DNA_START=182 /DNA_END=460 /DNA_ORIENTATION=+
MSAQTRRPSGEPPVLVGATARSIVFALLEQKSIRLIVHHAQGRDHDDGDEDQDKAHPQADLGDRHRGSARWCCLGGGDQARGQQEEQRGPRHF